MLCADYQVRAAAPPLFACMTSAATAATLLHLCWLMAICGAPFIGNTQPFVLPRSGRALWPLGQMRYIIPMCAPFWYAAVGQIDLCCGAKACADPNR